MAWTRLIDVDFTSYEAAMNFASNRINDGRIMRAVKSSLREWELQNYDTLSNQTNMHWEQYLDLILDSYFDAMRLVQDLSTSGKIVRATKIVVVLHGH